MPTIGVPKNSATIAPISASVELIFSALKTKGKAAGSRSLTAASASSPRRRSASGRAPCAPAAARPGERVHQHREEGHHHDDGGLRLPVEAEPHHHDRRDADDRQRRDEIAERQQPARRKGMRSIRMATSEARRRSRWRSPTSTPRRKVWTKSSPSIGSDAAKRAAIGARRRHQHRRHAEAAHRDFPQIEQRRAPNSSGTAMSRAGACGARVSLPMRRRRSDQRRSHDRSTARGEPARRAGEAPASRGRAMTPPHRPTRATPSAEPSARRTAMPRASGSRDRCRA